MEEKCFSLNNGMKIPVTGYGTYKLTDDYEGAISVTRAIKAGYRLIDCATAYDNQRAVGQGIKDSGICRAELSITGKVWITDLGYDSTLRSVERTLRELDLDYLDLYLIHWPASPAHTDKWKEINRETWRALESLVDEHVVCAIGLSNFMPRHIEPLLAGANIPPCINQLEFNPGCQQRECHQYCNDNGIRLEGWSPLARGRIFEDDTLNAIALKHGVTVAQVCLRWELQTGVISLPKSKSPERINNNLDIFNFELDSTDMHMIASLPPFGMSGLDPDA